MQYRFFGKTTIYVVLIIWALASLFPIYWMVVTSFKTQPQIYSPNQSFFPFLDFLPTLDNWKSTLLSKGSRNELVQTSINSLIASFGGALGATILGVPAAYALARFRFRRWSNESINMFMLAQRMFPPFILAVPYFVLFMSLGIFDSYLALILVYTAMNTPLVVWLTKDFFKDLPLEIEEAAMVDGCSRPKILWKIVIPLAAPGIFVAFLFSFTFAWNEFLLSLTLTYSNAKTLPYQIAGLVSHAGPRYGEIAAHATYVMMPMVVIAVAANKFIVRGLAAGAVK